MEKAFWKQGNFSGGARQVGLRIDKREIGVHMCWVTFSVQFPWNRKNHTVNRKAVCRDVMGKEKWSKLKPAADDSGVPTILCERMRVQHPRRHVC